MRPEKADVGINFTSISARERLLKVVKARGPNLNETIRFRFAGFYGYELVNAPPSTASHSVDAMVAEVIRVAHEEAAKELSTVARRTFMERLGVAKGTPQELMLDRALKRCSDDKKLERRPGGKGYVLPGEEAAA